jgi:hypothetical protein
MSLESARRTIWRGARMAGPAIDRIARFGFAAKGLVAVMIGALSLRLALGRRGGDIAGPGEALQQFLHQPFGWITLAVIAFGLWAYALWQLVAATLDPERKGTRLTAVAERIAFTVSAVGHATLGLAAIHLLFGQASAGPVSADELAAQALTPHVGRWIIGLVGAIIAISGILQLRFGIIAGFRPVLCLEEMSSSERLAVIAIGRTGYLALGVISSLIGTFLVRVAMLYDPEQAGGWDEALGFLARLEHGRWILGVVAAGIVCYGVYFILLVRYRRQIG